MGPQDQFHHRRSNIAKDYWIHLFLTELCGSKCNKRKNIDNTNLSYSYLVSRVYGWPLYPDNSKLRRKIRTLRRTWFFAQLSLMSHLLALTLSILNSLRRLSKEPLELASTTDHTSTQNHHELYRWNHQAVEVFAAINQPQNHFGRIQRAPTATAV